MLQSTLYSSIAALAFSSVAAAAITSAGSTVNVNGIFYYVPAQPVSSLKLPAETLKAATASGEDLIPMTVVTGNFTQFDDAALNSTISNFTEKDDVFSTGFLQVVHVVSPKKAKLQKSLKSTLSTFGNKMAMASSSSKSTANHTAELANGPYFVSVYTGHVYQAYRLYSDVMGAFTEGTIDSANGNFSTLSAAIPGAESSTIGVPSRLYYTKTEDKPLAGVRLGIKDIFDVAGTRRGCGNRAYYELYPERNSTAPSVQRLIDAGAIIIGKMKTSQFANGETATGDWIDYHAPFNPRGDGYQSPDSSSAGPGAGVGAYPWLDLAIGTDTGGSVRFPAQVNGAFGNRPTQDIVTLSGVMPLSTTLDTAGLITRDASLWKTAASILYAGNLTTYPSLPRKIYTSGFPINATTEAETILLSFLSKLTSFLNATSSALDYETLFQNSTAASKAGTTSVHTLLDPTWNTIIAHEQFSLLGIPFFSDYALTHNNRTPFIDPAVAVRWDFAATNNFSLSAGLENRTVFGEWWNGEVMVRSEESCSEGLFLYPGALATPVYRDVYLPAPGILEFFKTSDIAEMAGAPDVVIPIGQAPYNSTISNHVEYLPVSVDIVAAPGCDAMIFELAEQLQKAGIVSAVKTGSTLY